MQWMSFVLDFGAYVGQTLAAVVETDNGRDYLARLEADPSTPAQLTRYIMLAFDKHEADAEDVWFPMYVE